MKRCHPQVEPSLDLLQTDRGKSLTGMSVLGKHYERREDGNASVVIRKSKIQGKGVFARRDIKKGETVLKWDVSHQLKRYEVDKLTAKEKEYITYLNREYIQMQSPEKYVNHSCDANTLPKKYSDVAIRNIKKGEEITSDYSKTSFSGNYLRCTCGSKKCKGRIKF